MNIPNDLLYSKSHEWVKEIGEGKVQIGLTDFAQSELGDLVFVNLPVVGDEVVVGDSFADVESVKAVSDVYSPVTGEVCNVNDFLLDTPEAINNACYEAWLIEVENVTEKEDLLTAEQYEALLKEEE